MLNFLSTWIHDTKVVIFVMINKKNLQFLNGHFKDNLIKKYGLFPLLFVMKFWNFDFLIFLFIQGPALYT